MLRKTRHHAPKGAGSCSDHCAIKAKTVLCCFVANLLFLNVNECEFV